MKGPYGPNPISVLGSPAHDVESFIVGGRRCRENVFDADHLRPVLVGTTLQIVDILHAVPHMIESTGLLGNGRPLIWRRGSRDTVYPLLDAGKIEWATNPIGKIMCRGTDSAAPTNSRAKPQPSPGTVVPAMNRRHEIPDICRPLTVC